MIRVNLLSERRTPKKRFAFQVGQKLAVSCSLILVVAGLLVGWRYWSLRQQLGQLDTDLANARKETTRLHSIIEQVQQFEQRRGHLQERVGLIERLRRDQTGPVHMLDQISRALPPMLWLTQLKQSASSNDVVIDGRCASLAGLSDFVSNLESSGYFKRSVEIVSSVTEANKESGGDVVKFQVKAVFRIPGSPEPKDEKGNADKDAKASAGVGRGAARKGA
jgi:type IV pilus assembly protein PilN